MLNTGQLTGLLILLIIVLSVNISAADGHEIKKIDEILEMLNAQATEIANLKEKLA